MTASKRSVLAMCLLYTLGGIRLTSGFASMGPALTRLASLQPQRVGTNLGGALRKDPNSFSKLSTKTTTSALALPMFIESAAPISAGIAQTEGIFATLFENSNPALEAEVLNDMAHVSLDLVTLFGPATLVVRVAAVVGRMFAMAADYVPDHAMLPDELIFQLLMLGVAWYGLVKTALPIVFSAFASNIPLRDGKAFAALFRPAGMRWDQFKALSVSSLDWVTVPAGSTIATEEEDEVETGESGNDYIYWLYSGNMTVTSRGRKLYNVTRHKSTANPSDAAGLWGETRLLRRIDASDKDKQESFPPTTLTATGDKGATLLRLHTSNLSRLMDSDPVLGESMRNLVFHGMQAKLAAQFVSVPTDSQV